MVRGSANGRPPVFEAGCEGSTPSPRAGNHGSCVPLRGRMYQGGESALQAYCDGFDSHRLHFRDARAKRKVAGYGSPGRTANACPFTGLRVQIPCLPLELTGVCSWESKRPPKPSHRVRLPALLLHDPWRREVVSLPTTKENGDASQVIRIEFAILFEMRPLLPRYGRWRD
jgi:hypothetical protein